MAFFLLDTLLPLICLLTTLQAAIDDPKLYNVTQLTFGGDHSHPKFSPDGRYIYFSGKGGMYGKKCEDIYRLDLKYLSTQDPYKMISRVSPGIGHSTRISMPTNASDPNTAILYESSFET